MATATDDFAFPSPAAPEAAWDDQDASRFERVTAVVLFAALLGMTVALIGLKIATFPVRAMFAIGLLGLLAAIYPERLMAAVRQQAMILWLVVLFALLGAFVSAANGTGLGIIFRSLMEVPFQIGVTVLVATVLAHIAGPRWSVFAIVGVVAATTFVAILQFLDIGAAWDLRVTLARIQGISAYEIALMKEMRPMGLSASKIHLATQLCLAFGAYAAIRERQLVNAGGAKANADYLILAALFAMFVGCFASGTRAPILGGMIFFLVYALRRPGSWLLLLGVLGAAVLYLIGPTLLDMVQGTQPRFFRTDDNSASGRTSLFTFGLLLFADNPLGYGYAFDPTEHWMKFWRELYYQDHPTSVMVADLHNYPLNMLNTYGIGLLLVAPIVYLLLMRSRHTIIFFIPYIIQIMFHNSGPFWNDVVFWFVVGALSATLHSSRTLDYQQTEPRRRYGTAGSRAFGQLRGRQTT